METLIEWPQRGDITFNRPFLRAIVGIPINSDWTGLEKSLGDTFVVACHPIKEINNNNKPEKANYETGSLSQRLKPIQIASHGFHLIGELYILLHPRRETNIISDNLWVIQFYAQLIVFAFAG